MPPISIAAEHRWPWTYRPLLCPCRLRRQRLRSSRKLRDARRPQPALGQPALGQPAHELAALGQLRAEEPGVPRVRPQRWVLEAAVVVVA